MEMKVEAAQPDQPRAPGARTSEVLARRPQWGWSGCPPREGCGEDRGVEPAQLESTQATLCDGGRLRQKSEACS